MNSRLADRECHTTHTAPQGPPPTASADQDNGLIPPHCVAPPDTWIDIGLEITHYPPAELYLQLLEETQHLLGNGQADQCFFIHKPPGLRWRLHAANETPPADLRRAATAAAGRIVNQSLVQQAVYEPQQALFGGPLSMRFVHQSWCEDSLLWMRWHAENPHPPTTQRWDMSFRALAHVFTQLKVVGWEDREVWNHISQDTSRRLADHEWMRPQVVALARSLHDRWDQVWGTPHALPDPAQRSPILDAFDQHTSPVLSAWYDQCLSRPGTHQPLTPRRAAAYWSVFHWNRAGLTAAQQSLAAQALSGRLLNSLP
jgi:thiopeptide-type bacteriocin biosynthesis protein